MDAELHLIVLWANARYKEKEILDDVSACLEIRSVYNVLWDKDKVADNFSRFYGQKLPDKSQKEQECGTGSFLLLVVCDKNPVYDFVETSRGHELANVTLFNLKAKYRAWTGGGHKIHTTNSVQETDHDATLLLGKNYEDLKKALPEKWNNKIISLERNISGADGWDSLEELFYTLNSTLRYAVLRNHEILPHQFSTDLHGDIDILVEDYKQAEFILNTKKVFDVPYRVHSKNKVNGQEVFWDIRFLNDDYYCHAMEQRFLKNRVKNENGIYVLNDEDYFYALTYHALIHKREIASDYYDKLSHLFEKAGHGSKYNVSDYASPFDLYFELLKKFMDENGFQYTRPKDLSVFYSENFVNMDKCIEPLKAIFGCTSISPVYSDTISNAYNIFLKVVDCRGNSLFVKYGEDGYLYENEYKKAKELYDIDNAHFVKPFYYHIDGEGKGLFACEYMQGVSLEKIIEKNLASTLEKKSLIEDLFAIFKALKVSDTVHRDINPKNLIVSNGRLVLIDFQLSVSKTNYTEYGFLKKRPLFHALLGREGFAYGNFVWDDSYSLLKVLEFIGRDDSYATLYDSVYSEIQRNVGANTIRYLTKKMKKKFKRRFMRYKIWSKISFSSEKRKQYNLLKKEMKAALKLAASND